MERNGTINMNRGISIGLVVVLLTGIAANWTMWSAMSERQAIIETQVRGMSEDTAAIRRGVDRFIDGMTVEMRAMRTTLVQLRERVAGLEKELEKRK